MTLFPEAQSKAQAEIDAVIGEDRLPTLSDQDQLPYVCALIKEVLRFGLVVPQPPRLCRADDTYAGRFIPKDSIVLPNTWWVPNVLKRSMCSIALRSMSRDPRTYKDPYVFNPSRFLGEHPEQDPRTYFFGFGRRICPGRLYADNSTFLLISASLATLKISKAVGADGKEVTPLIEFEGGSIT
jgi:cytochrome P450